MSGNLLYLIVSDIFQFEINVIYLLGTPINDAFDLALLKI